MAESFVDKDGDGIFNEDIDIFNLENDNDKNGEWTGPALVKIGRAHD